MGTEHDSDRETIQGHVDLVIADATPNVRVYARVELEEVTIRLRTIVCGWPQGRTRAVVNDLLNDDKSFQEEIEARDVAVLSVVVE